MSLYTGTQSAGLTVGRSFANRCNDDRLGGNRLLLVGKRELTTIHLDQLQDSPSTVLLKKLFPLSLDTQDAKQHVYCPFTNSLKFRELKGMKKVEKDMKQSKDDLKA
uniref:Uncharacterized protein n=1 Tax=Globodera pallida TaxID=36090 RepID=A0A183BLS3_GLOPA